MNEPNYNESTLSGTSWNRVYACHIFNDYGQPPRLGLYEEKIAVLGDDIIKKHVHEFNVTFDPENEKHLQLYNLLNEMYVEQREIRDNPPVEEIPVEEPLGDVI
jgi:hypothetical protein